MGEEALPQRRLSIPAPGLHAAFRELDQRYLKPLFGGQMMPGRDIVPHRAPLRRGRRRPRRLVGAIPVRGVDSGAGAARKLG